MPDQHDPRLLARNLERLSMTDPTLAEAVRVASPDPRIVSVLSRGGARVPAVRAPTRTAPLHSLYDPRREARRLAQEGQGEGFVVVLGLGGGFVVEALLASPITSRVLVVEKDASVLCGLLACAELGHLLSDARLWITTRLADIRPLILSGWKPALMGGLRVIPLRPWLEQERMHFDAATAEIQDAVEAVRADYSVQAHFGKRWFANMLANLPQVRPASPCAPSSAAVVTAAGPSLEDHLVELADRPRGVLLVATDTSVPALIGSGVKPDAILSIDCQVYGYHHFLKGLPEGTALYLDLASPPVLARRFAGARFVASGHPFSRYILAHWLPLPSVDTSGGNVTHAAVSLARGLGAGPITIHGADFSYPRAKPYARGTYLYDVFQSGQCRLSPADSQMVSLAVRNATPERRGGKIVYVTATLNAYRVRLQGLMESVVPSGIGPAGTATRVPGWKDFLADYAARLRSRPAPAPISGMDEVWSTVLPVAARVVKEGCAPGAAALEEARSWSLDRVDRALTF